MHHSQSVPVFRTDKIRAFCRTISNSIAVLAGRLSTRLPGPRLHAAHKRQHQESTMVPAIYTHSPVMRTNSDSGRYGVGTAP
jgi:hypothetical protein